MKAWVSLLVFIAFLMVAYLYVFPTEEAAVEQQETFHMAEEAEPYFEELGITTKYNVFVEEGDVNCGWHGEKRGACAQPDKITFNENKLDHRQAAHEHLHQAWLHRGLNHADGWPKTELNNLRSNEYIQERLKDWGELNNYQTLAELFSIAGTELDRELLSEELNQIYDEELPNRHILFE